MASKISASRLKPYKDELALYDDCIITEQSSDGTVTGTIKPQLGSTFIQSLRDNEWLCDEHINAAQAMITVEGHGMAHPCRIST